MVSKSIIYADRQIKKFCWYGFLKNLKFFEPYLVIYLLGHGLNLFQVGLLYTVREVVINLFEVPSGIIADRLGCKKELMLSFVFYILSFVLFFLAQNFWTAAMAMALFGLGEAFRSGTHKAMIYKYLELQGWEDQKTLVYGKTRSASLVGSALSSIFFIGIILIAPENNFIFLASIVPYLLDFALIGSYPKVLNGIEKKRTSSFKTNMKVLAHHVFREEKLRRVLLGNGLFEGVIESSKDLLQPMLKMAIMGSGLVLIRGLEVADTTKIVLGLAYGVIYIFSALASKNAYRIKALCPKGKSLISFLNAFNVVLAVVLFALALTMKWPALTILFFLLMYVLNNTRKPIYVDFLGDVMAKNERVTILSISSQLKSLLTMGLAPLTGFVADIYGLYVAFLGLGGLLFLVWVINNKVLLHDKF